MEASGMTGLYRAIALSHAQSISWKLLEAIIFMVIGKARLFGPNC